MGKENSEDSNDLKNTKQFPSMHITKTEDEETTLTGQQKPVLKKDAKKGVELEGEGTKEKPKESDFNLGKGKLSWPEMLKRLLLLFATMASSILKKIMSTIRQKSEETKDFYSRTIFKEQDQDKAMDKAKMDSHHLKRSGTSVTPHPNNETTPDPIVPQAEAAAFAAAKVSIDASRKEKVAEELKEALEARRKTISEKPETEDSTKPTTPDRH